jgi:hypothetical protein
MEFHSTFRRSLADRLREVRIELFGDAEAGIFLLVGALGLPTATWRNFENGVGLHADVLLKFIELTKVSPHWLLTGEGKRYTILGPVNSF